MPSLTIRVPATTANLGPGYDCLGVALQLYNEVTIEMGGTIPKAKESEIVHVAGSRFFEASGLEPREFLIRITGEVPRSRGLGSSVTVRLGILAGLNMLCGEPLSRRQLFLLCAELEGHPDNAAPAAFGGFTVAGGNEVARFEVPRALRFILLIPEFEVSTPEARAVLPAQLDRLRAVQSCANACRITAAFASQNFDALRGSFADGLHQPFRRTLIPFLDDVIAAGERAGALGGFLSGSGSTICCVVEEKDAGKGHMAAAIGRAMKQAADGSGDFVICSADNHGAHVTGGISQA